MTDLSFSGPKDHLHSVVKTATSVAKLVLYEFDGFYLEFQQHHGAASVDAGHILLVEQSRLQFLVQVPSHDV